MKPIRIFFCSCLLMAPASAQYAIDRFTIGNANDALVVRVTGSITAPVRWVATMHTTELVFP